MGNLWCFGHGPCLRPKTGSFQCVASVVSLHWTLYTFADRHIDIEDEPVMSHFSFKQCPIGPIIDGEFSTITMTMMTNDRRHFATMMMASVMYPYPTPSINSKQSKLQPKPKPTTCPTLQDWSKLSCGSCGSEDFNQSDWSDWHEKTEDLKELPSGLALSSFDHHGEAPLTPLHRSSGKQQQQDVWQHHRGGAPILRSGKQQELASLSSSTCCHKDENDLYENDLWVEVEVEQDKGPHKGQGGQDDDNEDLIKMTKKVLNQHRHRHHGRCGHGGYDHGDFNYIHRAGKRGRSPPSKPSRKTRMTRRGPRRHRSKDQKSWKPPALAGPLLLDDKSQLLQVEVDTLRFSQESCKGTFQCGRQVQDLVDDLLNEKVSVHDEFLRLTVFETMCEESKETILRCIDNRRLLALKMYAKQSNQEEVMVNVNFYSRETLLEVQRFMLNSDDTNGLDIRLRGQQQH